MDVQALSNYLFKLNQVIRGFFLGGGEIQYGLPERCGDIEQTAEGRDSLMLRLINALSGASGERLTNRVQEL